MHLELSGAGSTSCDGQVEFLNTVVSINAMKLNKKYLICVLCVKERKMEINGDNIKIEMLHVS